MSVYDLSANGKNSGNWKILHGPHRHQNLKDFPGPRPLSIKIRQNSLITFGDIVK